MENIEKKLGTVVKWLRQKSGMTQDKLAQLLTASGTPMRQNTVAKLESGLRPTSVAEFGALANAFGLSVPELAETVFPTYDANREVRETSLAVREAQVDVLRLQTNLMQLQSEMKKVQIELQLREGHLEALKNLMNDAMGQVEELDQLRRMEG